MSVLLGEVRTALSRHSRAVSVDAVEELLELAPAAVRLTSRPLARAVVTGGRDDLSSGFLGPRRVDTGGAHRAGAIEPELSWVWAGVGGAAGVLPTVGQHRRPHPQ
ncbi:hypothetical protein MXD61_09505 [Frankia sp. AgPm24]|uniref:hypothetical protein n=1 Tax=Frankia sp. AgPm24 TaxID=631128 RepID=UPI00200D1846|nr:hypothetical protein [Frankia sp. AgPm24]MCK9922113.1 hypothetical protein [Frankia sp. AgPm24]